MALDRNNLAAGIKTAMKHAYDDKWSADQFADALADTIHAYTSAAEVISVAGEVTPTHQPVAQTGKGKLQ